MFVGTLHTRAQACVRAGRTVSICAFDGEVSVRGSDRTVNPWIQHHRAGNGWAATAGVRGSDIGGMGVFSCKKREWLGFNESFKGFGGEEYYIHEKYKQKGGRCICVKDFKWMHRFNRPNGIPFPNTLEDRLHNYIVGRKELNLPYDDVIEEFNKVLDVKVINDVIEQITYT